MANAKSTRECRFCGKQFQVTTKHPDVKACSPKCALRQFHDRACVRCGRVFRPKRESAKFCSRKCFGRANATCGLSKTREYGIWSKMLLRCYRPKNPNYRWYGGLGTYVCPRWRASFLAFVEDMGVAPTREHTLDRGNTRGHYTCGKCDHCQTASQPANCRWATKAAQMRNQKSNRWYTHDGKTLILKDWAQLTGVPYISLWRRLHAGFSLEASIAFGPDRRLNGMSPTK